MGHSFREEDGRFGSLPLYDNLDENKKRCVVQQVMLVDRSLESDVPAPLCMLKLTITPFDHITDRGKRYNTANKKSKEAVTKNSGALGRQEGMAQD